MVVSLPLVGPKEATNTCGKLGNVEKVHILLPPQRFPFTLGNIVFSFEQTY